MAIAVSELIILNHCRLISSLTPAVAASRSNAVIIPVIKHCAMVNDEELFLLLLESSILIVLITFMIKAQCRTD